MQTNEDRQSRDQIPLPVESPGPGLADPGDGDNLRVVEVRKEYRIPAAIYQGLRLSEPLRMIDREIPAHTPLTELFPDGIAVIWEGDRLIVVEPAEVERAEMIEVVDVVRNSQPPRV